VCQWVRWDDGFEGVCWAVGGHLSRLRSDRVCAGLSTGWDFALSLSAELCGLIGTRRHYDWHSFLRWHYELKEEVEGVTVFDSVGLLYWARKGGYATAD
jgi:hypothetical protein